MGTRSLTYVYDSEPAPMVPTGKSTQGLKVLCLYRQFDGYPSGHGLELAEFLKSFAVITNGISMGDKRKTANGMGCLAAQMVAHFKEEVGGFYLQQTEEHDAGQDYVYRVYRDRVRIDGEFDGTWDEFAYYCQKAE